jgi:4-amino-4-deoxy-L-arabinose transferase-like glycosyltransferase
VIPADLMEARNLATAQEMVKYGNYLLPTMNGEPRLEKPPLPTWIAAGIERLTPGNLVAQRYAAGLSAWLMIVFVFLLVRRLTHTHNRGVSLAASLILATSVNVILMGRTATWDIYTHSFMLGAIYFMVTAFEEKGAQWRYFLLSGLFIGLSFLSKGPVSMYALLLPFLISYFIVYRPNTSGKKWAITCMTLVGLAVSFWWYGYMYLFHSNFAVEIAQKESANWLNYNVRPWYYYWKFAGESGIWTLFWITAIIYFFINKQTVYRKEYTFSFIWFLASLVLLSVVPEKKMRYLLPLLIPGALLIGFHIYQMTTEMKTKGEKIVFRIHAFIISAVLFALPVALFFLFYRENKVSNIIQYIATICSWGFCTLIVRHSFGRKSFHPISVFFYTVLSIMMVTSIYLIPIGSMFLNEERRSIRLLREKKEVADMPFYYNDKEELRMELVYEASRRILKMNADDEAAIDNALPFVLISSESIEKLLSDKNVAIEFIGTFDNNWNKKGAKRHNPDLVKEAAIIRAKE